MSLKCLRKQTRSFEVKEGRAQAGPSAPSAALPRSPMGSSPRGAGLVLGGSGGLRCQALESRHQAPPEKLIINFSLLGNHHTKKKKFFLPRNMPTLCRLQRKQNYAGDLCFLAQIYTWCPHSLIFQTYPNLSFSFLFHSVLKDVSSRWDPRSLFTWKPGLGGHGHLLPEEVGSALPCQLRVLLAWRPSQASGLPPSPPSALGIGAACTYVLIMQSHLRE